MCNALVLWISFRFGRADVGTKDTDIALARPVVSVVPNGSGRHSSSPVAAGGIAPVLSISGLEDTSRSLCFLRVIKPSLSSEKALALEDMLRSVLSGASLLLVLLTIALVPSESPLAHPFIMTQFSPMVSFKLY